MGLAARTLPESFDASAEAIDHLEDLGDQIATLAAHLHSATHRLLVLVAEFDRLKGWEQGGFRSCAHWLAFRTGIDLGVAREKVRAARALEDLPETSVAMARGELSFAQVRALTRVATPENEGELLAFARESTAAQLERVVRGWRLLNRKDEAEMESVRHRSRRLSVFPGDDGMYVVRGRLDPEVGALLMRAIEAAGDALFRSDAAGDTPPEQRRADALGLLAERALAVGFGGTGEDRCKASDPSIPVPIPIPASVPVGGGRAERYHVVLHVEPGTLESDVEPGCSELEDGTRVSAETSRRLSCDASVVEVAHAPDGAVLDVGRRTRTVPPSIRRALEARDRGCRFPGCGLRFTDAHHIRHWADGGVTRLDNLISPVSTTTGCCTREATGWSSTRGPAVVRCSTTRGACLCRRHRPGSGSLRSPSRISCDRTGFAASAPTGALPAPAGSVRTTCRSGFSPGCCVRSTRKRSVGGAREAR